MEGELVQVDQAPRECCQDLANRTEPEQMTPDLSFTRCKTCNARHFVAIADLAEATAEGAPI
jgi:hypothetical protein